MIETIRNAWKIAELRKKILFTVFALLIFRLGSVVPVPFIDSELLGNTLNSMGGIFTLLGTMNGTAFSMAAVFALGVQPYINSSIIIQLLTVAIPALERLQRDGGEEGRKKLAAITRYVTVAIALLQGFGYYTLIRTQNDGALLDTAGLPGWWAAIVIILCFTAGSAFVMWLGEQITEFGIGNGISIILFAGILSRVPSMVYTMYQGISYNLQGITEDANGNKLFTLPWWGAILIIIGMLAIVVLIVFIQNSERRIPVQYAKRVVGRKMYGGQTSHIPLKVNMSGVMPIIFAQAIASLPATIGMFFGKSVESEGAWGAFLRVFNTTSVVYIVIYFLLIVGFSYFYSSMQFNPVEVANNLKKNGGFIPGFRPGKPTADFIHKVLGKITMFGALYLAVIAIAPIITGAVIGQQSLAIGGTSIIIVVGVALETTKALEAQMLMRHYKGFLE
ncbi:preprotein translocase subunit SecY [Flavonifractor sp. HCP28S3_F3]|uniref:preprotein translocase subunit SecY n=1 Tax=Flavonifractor sp. HCP28S3_F3 TaxID=3438939 RepID=UPI003F8994C1